MTKREDTAEDAKAKLRESNLKWFAAQFSGLHAKLCNHQTISELVDEGEGWYNLNFSGQPLYEPSAKECIEGQLEAFSKQPSRILLSPVQPSSFDRYASNFLHHFMHRIHDEELEISAYIPSTQSYYLIVMGFGLGGHIEDLVEKSNCQALILYEPNLEFIVHSLDVFDWQKLHDTMEDRGGYLNLVVSDNQEELFMRLKSDIRVTNPCSFDGTILFVNYKNNVFDVLIQRIYKDVNLILSGLGFYFDETVMIANTHANLSSGDARMIRFASDKIKSYPVFIIGSGPSLDKDIEWIKKNQDKAVIVACGSAIMPLMRNGIQPDFQVELENIPELYDMMLDTVKYVDVSKVHLLTTTTMDPRVAEFFDETSYYFRPALSSYPIFARPEDAPMHNGSPTVTNAGLALSQLFGFREFYIFGADMGSKVQGLAHSKHAWQNSDEGCEVNVKFNFPVRGNFGGTAYSHADMNWTRDELEQAIMNFHNGRLYYNCSDGAYIKGTIARHSRSVKLKDQPFKKAVEVKRIVDAFAPFPKNEFAARWTDEDMRQNFVDYCGRLLACFDDLENVKSKRALTEVNKLLFGYHASGVELGLAMIYRGSFWQALIGAEYYLNRIDGEEEHALAVKIFKEEYVAMIEHLRDVSIADIGYLSEHEWAPRPRILEYEVEEWD